MSLLRSVIDNVLSLVVNICANTSLGSLALRCLDVHISHCSRTLNRWVAISCMLAIEVIGLLWLFLQVMTFWWCFYWYSLVVCSHFFLCVCSAKGNGCFPCVD